MAVFMAVTVTAMEDCLGKQAMWDHVHVSSMPGACCSSIIYPDLTVSDKLMELSKDFYCSCMVLRQVSTSVNSIIGALL